MVAEHHALVKGHAGENVQKDLALAAELQSGVGLGTVVHVVQAHAWEVGRQWRPSFTQKSNGNKKEKQRRAPSKVTRPPCSAVMFTNLGWCMYERRTCQRDWGKVAEKASI